MRDWSSNLTPAKPPARDPSTFRVEAVWRHRPRLEGPGQAAGPISQASSVYAALAATAGTTPNCRSMPKVS